MVKNNRIYQNDRSKINSNWQYRYLDVKTASELCQVSGVNIGTFIQNVLCKKCKKEVESNDSLVILWY